MSDKGKINSGLANVLILLCFSFIFFQHFFDVEVEVCAVAVEFEFPADKAVHFVVSAGVDVVSYLFAVQSQSIEAAVSHLPVGEAVASEFLDEDGMTDGKRLAGRLHESLLVLHDLADAHFGFVAFFGQVCFDKIVEQVQSVFDNIFCFIVEPVVFLQE